MTGLRRLLRKKATAVRVAVSVSLDKVLRRLKEGRPCLGELFAGNYMFMQVRPLPTLACDIIFKLIWSCIQLHMQFDPLSHS